MTIYIDIIVIENIFMNYLILFICKKIINENTSNLRIILSSLIGTIYAISVLFFEDLNNAIIKIWFSIIMILVAFRNYKPKKIFFNTITFYVISFVFGGAVYALMYLINPEAIYINNGKMYTGYYPYKIVFITGIFGVLTFNKIFKKIKYKITKNNMLYDIDIKFKDKTAKVKAILDTR